MCVPTWLIPVGAELAIVAPVIDQVSEVKEQLSEIVASGTAIVAVQTPASPLLFMFAGHVIRGS
jgi:hypothetical protein